MSFSREHVEYALGPIAYLNDPLPVGFELREETIWLCYHNKFRDAVRVGRQFFQVGLDAGNTYVQAFASLLLGCVYFALGERGNDWDKALEFYKQGAQLFHSYEDSRFHNGGVAWLCIGRLYEQQCVALQRNRWEEAIHAYEEAEQLFNQTNDPLAVVAGDSARRATRKMKDWLVAKNSAQQFSTMPPAPKPKVPPNPGASSAVDSASADAAVPVESLRSLAGPAGTFILLILLFLLINMAFNAIVIVFAQYSAALFVGYILAIIVFLIIPLAVRSVCSISADHAAIIEYRGRVWEIEEPGRHWLVPFLDRMVGSIKLVSWDVRVSLRDFSTPDGFVLAVDAAAKYAISDPRRLWAVIGPFIQSSGASGAFRNNVVKRVEEEIGKTTQKFLVDTLVEIANDQLQRDLYIRTDDRDRLFLNLITTKSGRLGLRFNQIHVEPHVRSSPHPRP